MNLLFTVLCVAIIIFRLWKNRSTLKELKAYQIVGAAMSYLFVILIAFGLVYYGGNWIAGKMPNDILKTTIFLAVVLVVLSLCVKLLHKLLNIVTNGVLLKK